MAIVRCESWGVKPAGREHYKRSYVGSARPVGHPASGVICGTPSCKQPGLIWLEAPEMAAYKKGERIFALQTNTTKVKAE